MTNEECINILSHAWPHDLSDKEEEALTHAIEHMKRKPVTNWRELIGASSENFIKNFGFDVYMNAATWVYKDLVELFECAEQETPKPESEG